MTKKAVFERMLRLREREKQAAQQAFSEKQSLFEAAASKLYALLKRKEEAEFAFSHSLSASLPITSVADHHDFLEKLNIQINSVQREVQFARSAMQEKQILLNEAYVEFKKIEKLIEKKRLAEMQFLKQEEAKQMDELSTRQFLVNGAR